MKILAIEIGRTGAVFPVDEALPLNGIYPPDVSRAIAERYSFLYPPDLSLPLSEVQAKGLEFKVGKFQAKDGTEHNVESLHVLGLGIVASAHSTEVAQLFLEDVFEWADKTLGFRFSSVEFKYFFLSRITVQFDKTIDHAIKNFQLLSSSIGEAIQATYEITQPAYLSAIIFDYDRTLVPDELKQLSAFTIERQADQPYKSNRFFCQAPLRTKDHIRLLEEFEARLASR